VRIVKAGRKLKKAVDRTKDIAARIALVEKWYANEKVVQAGVVKSHV
jgi:hypothetical protein